MKRRHTPVTIRVPISERAMMVSIYLFIAVFTLFCLIPFWLVVSGSITPEHLILRDGYRLFPEEISFNAYKTLLTGKKVYDSYKVTVFITVVGTLLSLLVTAMMAYALSIRGLHFTNSSTSVDDKSH